MPTDRVLADFIGVWSVNRIISPKTGPTAHFDGTARWAVTADGADYTETGTLQMVGASAMQAERKYRWSEDLSVYFDDGRFFHDVPKSGGQTQHFCDPDLYDGTYDFADWPSFRVTWKVQGPRKDYTMISTFTRLAAP